MGTKAVLTKHEREMLKQAGVTHAVVIDHHTGSHGEVDKKLRARVGETTMYGWFHYGDGAKDIRWYHTNH